MLLRLIDEVLGRDVCEALLGFHALTGCEQTGTLTGCEQTGKFYGHSKQTFLSSPPDVIKAFQNLGVDLGNQEKDSLVKYVMDLYCKGRPSTISNLGELTWLLFSKYQTESSASSYNESVRTSYPEGTFHYFTMEVITHCFTKSS